MDAYPRSKTWPYVALVSLLFVGALWYPDWWVGRRHARTAEALARRAAVIKERRDQAVAAGSVRIALEAELQGPVARRATGSSSEPAHEADRPATSSFPPDRVADPPPPLRDAGTGTAPAGPRGTGTAGQSNLAGTGTAGSGGMAANGGTGTASSVGSPVSRPAGTAMSVRPGTGTVTLGRGEASPSSGGDFERAGTGNARGEARGEDGQSIRSPGEEQVIGPIPSPAAAPPLDLTPADLEGIAGSLPATPGPSETLLQTGADATAPLQSTWPRPVSLCEMLAEIRPESGQVATWINQAQDVLGALASVPSLDSPAAADIFDQLDALAAQCPRLEVYLTEENRRTLRRVRYGLERRTAIWRQVQRLAAQQRATPHRVEVIDAAPVIEAVEKRLADHPYGDTWRAYLKLEDLMRVATETWVTDPLVRATVARDVLQRMAHPALTPEQLHTLGDPAVEHLRRKLEDWAEVPIDLLTLVAALEQYEQIRSNTIAAQVVEQMESLAYSRHSAARQLHSALDVHYRNANVRLSISAQLLNDLLPVIGPQDRVVRDQILGARVQGRNRTWTDLSLRLLNDAEHLRLLISAEGQSQSRTLSAQGPVRMLSRDQSRFQADKELIVSPEGIFTYRAAARASGQTTLLDLETRYDQIPVLGWLVRRIALDRHAEQRQLVRAEINDRISRRARQQLDDSIHQRLTNVEGRLERGILEPLRDLELDPTTMEMRTTDQRLVMRYRLASDAQLAAYTPRPRGLPDNALSIQLHESLPNNLLAQLELEDRRVELEKLMKELSEKLHIQRQDIHEEIPPEVVIHLGPDRPIQFEFDNDRVLVTVRIKELQTPKRRWRNFVVRGRYRMDVAPTHVDLQRDGGIELISEQLGFRDQVTLRGIFTKAMTRDHRLNILRGRFISDPHLNRLGVTQFVARDGWIGLSVGPLSHEQLAAAVRSDERD